MEKIKEHLKGSNSNSFNINLGGLLQENNFQLVKTEQAGNRKINHITVKFLDVASH